MIANSLRFRLLCAAAMVILLALPIAGAALLVLFERNVMRQIDHELDADIEQLIANIERDEGDVIDLGTEPADPRFRQPLAGRYWQISSQAGVVLRSRSLWDVDMATGTAPDPKQGTQRIRIPGPDGQQLYGAIRSIILEPETPAQKEQRLILVTAMDSQEITTLKQQFRSDVTTALGGLALLLIAAAWVQVSLGLRPLELLRSCVEKVRLGQARRIDGALPRELQPLASETNRLLEVQETAIERARARAGDLAHGLKTPLTALTVLVQRLREQAKPELAAEIETHLHSLNSHIERELVRTRIAAEAGLRRNTQLSPILDRILRTLRTLPRGDDIDWHVTGADGITLPVDEADLAELLGNVLDNARKWSRLVVEIGVRKVAGRVTIRIDDDGPGIRDGEQDLVLQRGRRLDERKPGSGLGMTIVKDIVEAYGGEIEVKSSPLGGLAVVLNMPTR